MKNVNEFTQADFKQIFNKLDNKNKNIIKVKQKTKHEKKINNNNNINISDELDKFKNRIDNIFKIIDNFEKNYLNSSKPKKIKKKI